LGGSSVDGGEGWGFHLGDVALHVNVSIGNSGFGEDNVIRETHLANVIVANK